MADDDTDATLAEGRADDHTFHVVGIGASSGGLAALQTLMQSLPHDPGFACVIVMHLSPEHESHLSELLQQHSRMPVQQVVSTVAIEPDRVYVIPPNANLNTIDTHLRLTELEERRTERAPIDHFLRTLAATHDGTAIGVILTGAGSDGSIGLRHIRECGGLTIAQDPEEAAFDSMPRSAIATGMVDLVLPLSRISDEILEFCRTRPRLPAPGADDADATRDAQLFERILNELRNRTQHDFRIYRRQTLLRRLRRRMQLLHVTSLTGYLEIFSRESKEAEALTNDLLLMPTEFFRDDAAFLALEQRIIPQMFARKSGTRDRKSGTRDRMRVWSIGCSTGEEAYSVAMLLLEQRARENRSTDLQVFASDLSEKVLAVARDGIYPLEIAASVTEERLARFFTQQPGFFRVKRELHDIILFASHNIFEDPPFAHLDLIVCRTLFSELRPEVRRGLIALFHYSLEPEGILLVGAGDELEASGLFQPVEGSIRVFRKIGERKPLPALPSSMRPFGPGGVRGLAQEASRASDIATLHRSAMESYGLASVVIDKHNQVAHFSTNAGRYLHIPGGELTQDITRLVREPIRFHLFAGLQSVRDGGRGWRSEPLTVTTEEGRIRLVLRIECITATGLLLVVFDDRDSPGVWSATSAATAFGALTQGLQHANVRLQDIFNITPGGDATAGERVQAAATELQEVLEELATAKEELQAVNEELILLDEENRRRVQELTRISNDLEHLLAATGIATLFLDEQLRIVRFTPAFGELFGLRVTDIGRSPGDLARLGIYAELETDMRRTLLEQRSIDREVEAADGRWFLLRALPYRTEGGQVEGAVLTLFDISERKRAERAVEESSRQKDDFLAVLAHELRNPLAPISAGIQVLKTAPGDRRVVERMANTMDRQSKQLIRLVDDLLEVSRISGGKLRLRNSIVPLNEAIQDAIASVKPAIENAGHTLNVYFRGEPAAINGDAARLTQVISNILSNAVRYTPRPGTISVMTSREDGTAVVSVKDDGVGMSQECLAHVFEMFYQGNSSHHEPGAGLGIGLTLAKSLIDMHGGTITVESAGENQGSQFTIRLPLASSAAGLSVAPVQPTLHEARKPSGDHRILIVDDNVDAAETLCMLMKSLGEREVHTASSGEQALETAPALHPDIVLLDLMMPKMDGYEVARRMRCQPWGKNVLLVAVSGLGHEDHRRRSKEAGFDRHVTKPADLAALQAVLSERPERV